MMVMDTIQFRTTTTAENNNNKINTILKCINNQNNNDIKTVEKIEHIQYFFTVCI